jgi:hypothetical protein
MAFVSTSLDATVPYPAPSLDATFRPARALIGWMEAEQAHLALSHGHDGGVTAAMTDRASRTRRAATTAHNHDEAEASISFEIDKPLGSRSLHLPGPA